MAEAPPPIRLGIQDYADHFDATYPGASPYAKEAARSLSTALMDGWNQGTPEMPIWNPAAYTYDFNTYLSDVVMAAREAEALQRHLGQAAVPPSPPAPPKPSPPAPPVGAKPQKFEPQPVAA